MQRNAASPCIRVVYTTYIISHRIISVMENVVSTYYLLDVYTLGCWTKCTIRVAYTTNA